MPARYKGTGAPGLFLEDRLGLTTGNQDIPDSVGWELKFYTPRTHFITLFRKEPQPAEILRYRVRKHGWKDTKGRKSFRHTIAGRSDRFRVDADANQIIVRPLKGNGPVPYWTENDILSVAGGKLRRVLFVRGSRNGQRVTYDRIDAFEHLDLSSFIFEVMCGTIKVDFDARESSPGSAGLRNHGTKFRVAQEDVCRLYTTKNRVA